MNTKWKVILSVMLLIALICAVFIVLVKQLNDEKLHSIIAGKRESATLMASTLLSDFSQVYRERIITFTNPRVSPSRDLMIRAFAERDREKLYQLSKPLLEVFKKNPYFSTIGWLLPDNRVFLRIHAPGMFGDEVSKLRPDIATTNRDKQQQYGFDAGVSGMQYRVVQPVFYENKYIGAVQFGIEASFIFDALKKSKLNTHTGMAVLNSEAGTVLKSKLPKLICGTHTITARDAEIYESLKEELDWNKEEQRVILHDKEHVILNIHPVGNYRNDKLGTFFVALKISEELAHAQKLLLTILLIAGLILLFSFLILYFSYGSLVEKIVNLNKSLELNNLELENRVIERTTKLHEREKELHKAQKMEAIGLMASGVAHDLNNSLSAIINYPELMLLKLPESSEMRAPVRAIQKSGERAATVVADLLTIARGAASVRKPHDINVLIQEYLDSPEYQKLQSQHPGVACQYNLEASDSTVSCSPVHIKKVVMNLMTNAMEAVGVKGETIISTFNLEIDPADEYGHNLAPGKYAVLAVQDDGPGIADKDIEHIFEPFYTKKVMGKSGSGLGLAVVWNTIEDHGGKIFVESSDMGTSFQLFFPVSGESAVIQIEDEPIEPASGNNESILVVDDEPDLQDIACQILTTVGYNVRSVGSGEEAIEFVKEHPVDLLVIDMLMDPGINGLRTYEAILKDYPDQKAIIASGFSESADVKKALQLGAGGFIKKPYLMSQLAKAVRETLYK